MAGPGPIGSDERRPWTRTQGSFGRNDPADPNNPVEIPKTPGSIDATKKAAQMQVLQTTLAKVDDLISKGRSAGYRHAADNLQYWRSGKGGTRTMPASAFKDEAFVNDWLKKKVWPQFTQGAERRLKSGELKPGGQVDMYWTDSLYAPYGHQLYFALGGFTIRSDVTVRAVQVPAADGGGLILEFSKWTCQASDVYNWDKMKSTLIPLFGRIRDEELLVLEENGYGRSFDISSESWEVTDPSVRSAFSVSGF